MQSAQYVALVSGDSSRWGPLGDHRKGEIEILTEPAAIQNTMAISHQRLCQQGMSSAEAAKEVSVGIVAEDRYWMWVRDAVIFPSQARGTYNRIIPRSVVTHGHPGAAALPLVVPSSSSCSSSNARVVVLVVTFRHATRSWEAEIPRGGPDPPGESPLQAACREVEEETGWRVVSGEEGVLLGHVNSDTGELAQTVPVFLLNVQPPLQQQQQEGPTLQGEYSEAISGCAVLTVAEVKAALAVGHLAAPTHAHVRCRDPYLAFALLQCMLRGIL